MLQCAKKKDHSESTMQYPNQWISPHKIKWDQRVDRREKSLSPHYSPNHQHSCSPWPYLFLLLIDDLDIEIIGMS